MKKLIALKHKLDEMKVMGNQCKKEALANMDDFRAKHGFIDAQPFHPFWGKRNTKWQSHA